MMSSEDSCIPNISPILNTADVAPLSGFVDAHDALEVSVVEDLDLVGGAHVSAPYTQYTKYHRIVY